MRSRIINWSLALVAVLLLPQVSKAQIAASNPLEWIALAEGNEPQDSKRLRFITESLYASL